MVSHLSYEEQHRGITESLIGDLNFHDICPAARENLVFQTRKKLFALSWIFKAEFESFVVRFFVIA